LAATPFAGATLDAPVNAAARFSAAIGQQLVMVQDDPPPAEFAEKTVAYTEAKTAYFTALRQEMPELINIATGKESRPVQLEEFTTAFSVASEKTGKGDRRSDTDATGALFRQSWRLSLFVEALKCLSSQKKQTSLRLHDMLDIVNKLLAEELTCFRPDYTTATSKTRWAVGN
jgi:hypothetical protein